MSILIFIIILLVLVLFHEFGHFFAAKRFGIRVDEFGFGFPPKIFGKKIGETEYTLNLLPLGGFVRIFGENPEDEDLEALPLSVGKAAKSRSFAHKPKWQQAVILFAGIFANFLLAWLLFSVGFMFGFPTSVGSQPTDTALSNVFLTVTSVVPKSPADLAGLKSGDKIVEVTSILSNYPTAPFPSIVAPTTDQLKSFVLNNGNKEIQIDYLRGENSYNEFNAREQAGKDSERYAVLTPIFNKTNNEPEIGISMDEIGTLKLPFFSALWQGLRLDWSTTKDTATGLYTLIADAFRGKGSLSSVTGPVGLVGIVGSAYSLGFAYLLSLTALISVNLAIINLIPFPALDGGRLLFLLIEKINGTRINPKFANAANMIGFGILILLMLVITYHDVVHLF